MNKLKIIFLVAMSVAGLSATAVSERESEGTGIPSVDVNCESTQKDVSARIMRYSDSPDVTRMVIIHRATMLLFTEEVTLRNAQEASANRVYSGKETDLTIAMNSPVQSEDGVARFSAVLETRPYSGYLELACEVIQ